MIEGIELPNLGKFRTLGEKVTYRYLGMLKADTIKEVELEVKVFKKYLRRKRKQLKTKLNNRNFVKGINT